MLMSTFTIEFRCITSIQRPPYERQQKIFTKVLVIRVSFRDMSSAICFNSFYPAKMIDETGKLMKYERIANAQATIFSNIRRPEVPDVTELRKQTEVDRALRRMLSSANPTLADARRRKFPDRKRSMPFLTVDAILSNGRCLL